MRFEPTTIPDVVVIHPAVFADERGYFFESFQSRKYAAAGIVSPFVQDNQSGSRRGVLHGLHYQIRSPQGKLVSVVAGEVFDVALELRRSSPNFGRWVGVRLSPADHRQVWTPPGFAHGFFVLSDWVEVTYKATDYYSPEHERTLLWDDSRVGVDWQLPAGEKPLLSPKDSRGLRLGEAEVYD
jgi:dTDP-4-dehydrorhamnose 3,5-epimerase